MIHDLNNRISQINGRFQNHSMCLQAEVEAFVLRAGGAARTDSHAPQLVSTVRMRYAGFVREFLLDFQRYCW